MELLFATFFHPSTRRFSIFTVHFYRISDICQLLVIGQCSKIVTRPLGIWLAGSQPLGCYDPPTQTVALGTVSYCRSAALLPWSELERCSEVTAARREAAQKHRSRCSTLTRQPEDSGPRSLFNTAARQPTNGTPLTFPPSQCLDTTSCHR